MILIADSGSTKTDWRICKANNTSIAFKTKGLNPHFIESKEIEKEIKDCFPKTELTQAVTHIFFYGSGCKAEHSKLNLKKALNNVFQNASCEVETDLVGAARAMLGNNNGIISILGTGMNSGFWSKCNIETYTPSLGFILGDEGSGAHLGKQLLQAVFYENLPEPIISDFFKEYPITIDDVITRTYKTAFPNQYLASFVPFLENHISCLEIRHIVENSFREFIEKHILKITKKTQFFHIFVIGSVGYYFNDILALVSKQHNITIARVEKSPIEFLCDYHREI